MTTAGQIATPPVAQVWVGFAGPVRCLRGVAPLALTLSGQMRGSPPGHGTVVFNGPAPADLPDTLTDARIEPVSGSQYRLTAGAQQWLIEARSIHVHRDVGKAFYRAIPPRPAPWRRRIFFRTVLWLAASHRGMALLRRLRAGRRTKEESGGG
jgi:hypothetical protein